MYDFGNIVNTFDLPFRKARRVCRRAQKKHKDFGTTTIKFGVEVPRTVREALEFDKKNGDHKWAEAIQKEMQGLYDHKTFKFLDPNEQIPNNYQQAPLRMIFDMKPDLRHKAWSVTGGHVIDSSEHSGYSSVVKMTSIRLLNVITKA